MCTKQFQRVWAEVDLDAIVHNEEEIERIVRPQTSVMPVIKADAYGHGAIPIARELESRERVFGFCTATAEEAFSLREAGIKKPILVLGYTFPDSYEELARQHIRPTVFRVDQIAELAKCAERLGIRMPVHVKVDTGMRRIGISPDEEGLAFVERLGTMPQLEAEGIFTHFARADEADKGAAYGQLSQFQSFVSRAEELLGGRIPLRHCSNSAAILDIPSANLDMVRAGIILYGILPSSQVRQDAAALLPALSLKSRIVYVKTVGPGCEISYNGTYVTKRVTRVATLPVGYADGYPRSLSNKGSVLIAGKRAPILGRICMDQCMVDVTDIPEARLGSVVTLLGGDEGDCISMEEAGAISGRFPYELACDLGKRVPKVYLRAARPVGSPFS